MLLIDDETRTYWDHITGKAVHGPLEGHQLETWPIHITTAENAQKTWPDLEISISRHRSFLSLVVRAVSRLGFVGRFLPPFFVRTMGSEDLRRPRMELGLGVVVDGEARFYPQSSIEGRLVDIWGQRNLIVSRGELDGLLRAVWETDGREPFQLLARWYGFSLTYPGCQIFSPEPILHQAAAP